MKLNGLFEFSLRKTVRKMYKAGVYALVLLILVFSGILSYAKLILVLFAYIVPQDILLRSTCEELLIGWMRWVDSFLWILMLWFCFWLSFGFTWWWISSWL